MFCTYTACQVLNAALIQLGRVKASILWSLTSAVLKLAVAFALVGGKSNYPSPFPAIFANTIADGVAAIGSGGNYALAAARALVKNTEMSAEDIAVEALTVASSICVYTNDHITVETL